MFPILVPAEEQDYTSPHDVESRPLLLCHRQPSQLFWRRSVVIFPSSFSLHHSSSCWSAGQVISFLSPFPLNLFWFLFALSLFASICTEWKRKLNLDSSPLFCLAHWPTSRCDCVFCKKPTALMEPCEMIFVEGLWESSLWVREFDG